VVLTGYKMIPISKPQLGNEEANAASNVVLSGWVTQGPKVKEFEDSFKKYVQSKFAIAVSSCTAALHLALLAVGVKPGDLVITPSHSFIATANAIRHCGAEPIFIDIDPVTYNIKYENILSLIKDKCIQTGNNIYYKDISKLSYKYSPLKYIAENKIGRISAILPVHQMGMPCQIYKIKEIATHYNLPVVEDAACAFGSEVKFNDKWEKIGKPHGDIACFSFHPRKIITTGDGGMLTTNNPKYNEQLRLLRQHGMDINDHVRHGAKDLIIENYKLTGFNYRMTDIQGAVGFEQIKKTRSIINKHRKIAEFYKKELSDIDWLSLPKEPFYAKANYQSYPIRVLNNSPVSRNNLITFLLKNDIASKPGIMNSHKEVPYIFSDHKLINSEKARDEVILLPMYRNIKNTELKYITSKLRTVNKINV